MLKSFKRVYFNTKKALLNVKHQFNRAFKPINHGDNLFLTHSKSLLIL